MAKRMVQYFFLVSALPLYALYGLDGTLLGRRKAFMGMSQWLALVPGFLGPLLRGAFYHLAMRSCPQDCTIEFLTTFVTPDTVIGKNTYIGSHCNISMATIGDDCLIGTGVMITSGTGQHVFASRETPIRLQGGAMETVRVGRDCWIGNGAIVMADLGEGCVVAAGSVVTKPLPPYSIAAGVPARVIGERGCSPK